MRKYTNKAVAELSAELSSGLRRLRKGYLDAAEELLRLIDPEQSYPYEFVVYRLTGYRPQSDDSSLLLEGSSLRGDLLNLLLDLSESFDLRTSQYDEPIYDTAAFARKQNVSTKTVQRWRKRGLPAIRPVFPDGKRRIAFRESSLQWFVGEHAPEVQRSAQFSQMSDAERRDILRRAMRMASFTQCSLSDVARRLARRTGRAVETIRYTIRQHDNDNPEQAIFPNLLKTLGQPEKRRIYRAFLRGTNISELARQYQRTRGSMYRIVNEMRAKQLLERPISYIHNEEFEVPHADKTILDESEDLLRSAGRPVKGGKNKVPEDLPPYLRSLYEVPLLSTEEERLLFRRYNYLKFKAARRREGLDTGSVTARQVKDVESLLLKANLVKNRIIRANLRLVVSIAKKHVAGPLSLFELISDGNVSLMRAVEKFDYARGYRFSTYASWAIMRNFARSVPRERYQLDRFATGHEEVVDIAASLKSYDPEEDNLAELRESIDVMLEHLSSRERTILIDHYGLDEATQAKTFDQLGRQLGISKERVRQIEIQALQKLRDFNEVDEA
jgi:RNA polymerase primary sigma factor